MDTHPDTAIGWTHIWDGGREQLAIDDDIAVFLVAVGKIRYAPDNGPNARVYRPLEGVTMEKIKSMLVL